jgi:3-hydroxyisobutyrate dehydrogenase-like beta-hydroxyacid dehydrogenase
VYGTNRIASKASALTGRGLIWRDTPREVAEAAEVIFSMVTDDAALDAITSGLDGILAGLSPGKVYADMSAAFFEVLAQMDGAPARAAGPAKTHVSAAGTSRIALRGLSLTKSPRFQELRHAACRTGVSLSGCSRARWSWR